VSLEAQIQSLTYPAGTEFPPTMQALSDLLAQYFAITGLDPFNGINYGPITPDANNRDRPWFKTLSSGEPVGWFSWSGSEWTQIPQAIPFGSTAQRPSSPAIGTQFFDTDIAVALVFERGRWSTIGGSPGDIKAVNFATIGDALVANPGWAQYIEGAGRVIGVAGNGAGLTARAAGDEVGDEEVTLELEQIPEHNHQFTNAGSRPRWSADGNVVNASGNLCGYAADTTQDVTTTPSTGEGNQPHNNMQPTRFLFWLIKE